MIDLITAKDVAARDGAPTVRDWLMRRSQLMVSRSAYRNAWDGKSVSVEQKVVAFVDHNRWLAECPFCHAFEYVFAGEPVFFCTRCGNNDSRIALPVIFPDNMAEIEQILRQKPVQMGQGLSVVEKNLYGQNERNWRSDPGEIGGLNGLQ